jgi:trimethylamine--corrinoid protein Co-methyltransferase
MTTEQQTQTTPCRPGVVVDPVRRLDQAKLDLLHQGSLKILQDPGIVCFNEQAVSHFSDAGCETRKSQRDDAWIVRIPERVVLQALQSVPSRIVLGARKPENNLILDAEVPRIYFGSGSETNVFLETRPKDSSGSAFEHVPERGSIQRLCDSSRLCNSLENLDFFIRNVNIQDEDVSSSAKDVNVFFASLKYMTKHVQAGLTDVGALDDVVRLAQIIAGGEDAFRAAPLISFIACLVKSPLQMVDDTTAKVIAFARRNLPLVISSSPQGGSTAPVQEEGMVMMINAEILSGITLTQLVSPGTPVLYGAVPVRARLDTLHDLYGAPEFVQYNIDCVQLARKYGVPCYSTAGVGDAAVPGMQATVEKTFSHLGVAQSGAQYIHYAFGLLDRTNIFSPVQAIIDNASIGLVKSILRPVAFEEAHAEAAVAEIRKVMQSSTRLFARHIRKQIRRGVVSDPYPLAGDGKQDEVLLRACKQLEEVRNTPGEPLPDDVINKIHAEIPGLVAPDRFQP